jgi:hypothetical protein
MGAASIQRNAYLRNQNWQLCDEKCVRTRPPFVFFFPIRPSVTMRPEYTPPHPDSITAALPTLQLGLTSPTPPRTQRSAQHAAARS